jgi:hypothetical protein
MKESYSEVRAGHADPESYADGGNTLGVATAGAHAGRDIELRKPFIFVCRRCSDCGRQHHSVRYGKCAASTAESKTLSMCGNFKRENREIPSACWRKSPAAVRKLHWRHS